MPPSLSTQKKPNLSARIEIAKALLLTCAGTLNFNLAREKQSKNPWGILQTWQHRHSCKHPKKYRYTYIHIYVVFIYIKTRKHHLKCHQMWIIHHRVGDSFPPHLCSTLVLFPAKLYPTRLAARNHWTKCQNLWKKSLSLPKMCQS